MNEEQNGKPPEKPYLLVKMEEGVAVLFRREDGMQLGSTKEGVCFWGGEEDFPHKKCRAFMSRKHAVEGLLKVYGLSEDSVDYRDGTSRLVTGRDDADARLRQTLTM